MSGIAASGPCGTSVLDVRAAGCLSVFVFLALWFALTPRFALAQDTPRVEEGVRLGITYTPGMRPGMLVLGGPRRELLDSVRAILQRDLGFSDLYEMIYLPGGDSLVLGVQTGSGSGEVFVNYSLYGALGAEFAVSVLLEVDSATTSTLAPMVPDTALTVGLYDVRGQGIRAQILVRETDPRSSEFRFAVHRAADEIVRVTTGEPGIAATRIVFVSRAAVYTVDADGASIQIVSSDGVQGFSPGWHPGGWELAYTDLNVGTGTIRLHDLRTRRTVDVAPTTEYQNISPRFSPDGRTLVFARVWGEGTHLFSYNLTQDCCLQRLTVGRFSDNLSPAFSPDGRRIAFESTRAGLAQIYVMAADGTGQELFAPYDYGVTGDSHSPDWSPDGLWLAFHRTVASSPQIFVMDVRSNEVRQLTSFGRNEDPTWAPDSRHIAFKSNRTGPTQLWMIDLETGRVRQLTSFGGTRFPNWSRRIPIANEP